MELLNDSIINSHRFEIVSTVLKVHYQNQNDLRPIISYNEFKETIEAFVEKIMREYLENTDYYYILSRCIIKSNLIKKIRGEYESENNTIIINEDVIKKIYDGEILELITIFHELNHFKVLFDLRLEKINFNLIRIAKEKLISLSEDDGIKDIKKDEFGLENSQYYVDNYDLHSEELFVDNEAIKDFIYFCQLAGIQLGQSDLDYLENRTSSNFKFYENYLRDFRSNINFNSNYLDFEEAFDMIIRKKPEWIQCPQLKIEYYLDENGQVKRRNKEELLQLQSSTDDEEIKQVIQEILEREGKKRLDKIDFYHENYKIDKENFYNIIENNYHKK